MKNLFKKPNAQNMRHVWNLRQNDICLNEPKAIQSENGNLDCIIELVAAKVLRYSVNN